MPAEEELKVHRPGLKVIGVCLNPGSEQHEYH